MTHTYKCRVYEVEGANNVRDLGGYAGAGSKTTAFRRFIRAGEVGGLSERGCGQLRALGISCIVDLRSRMEEQRSPDSLKGAPGVRHVHIPMLDYLNSNLAAGEAARLLQDMSVVYIGLLDRDGGSIKQVLDVMAEEGGPVLFHCTAGKDRTGVVAMLLLSLAGVDEELILEDYSYSQELLAPVAITPELRDLPRHLFESRPEVMRKAVRHLKNRYGGVGPYLKEIGVDEDQQGILLGKLLADGNGTCRGKQMD